MKVFIVLVKHRTDPDNHKVISEIYLDKDRAVAAGKFIEQSGTYYTYVEEHMVN